MHARRGRPTAILAHGGSPPQAGDRSAPAPAVARRPRPAASGHASGSPAGGGRAPPGRSRLGPGAGAGPAWPRTGRGARRRPAGRLRQSATRDAQTVRERGYRSPASGRDARPLGPAALAAALAKALPGGHPAPALPGLGGWGRTLAGRRARLPLGPRSVAPANAGQAEVSPGGEKGARPDDRREGARIRAHRRLVQGGNEERTREVAEQGVVSDQRREIPPPGHPARVLEVDHRPPPVAGSRFPRWASPWAATRSAPGTARMRASASRSRGASHARLRAPAPLPASQSMAGRAYRQAPSAGRRRG